MNITELNREQIIEVKQRYMVELADDGMYQEVTGNESPSWYDMATADILIPDDVVFDHYAGTEFTADDFFCMTA